MCRGETPIIPTSNNNKTKKCNEICANLIVKSPSPFLTNISPNKHTV